MYDQTVSLVYRESLSRGTQRAITATMAGYCNPRHSWKGRAHQQTVVTDVLGMFGITTSISTVKRQMRFLKRHTHCTPEHCKHPSKQACEPGWWVWEYPAHQNDTGKWTRPSNDWLLPEWYRVTEYKHPGYDWNRGDPVAPRRARDMTLEAERAREIDERSRAAEAQKRAAFAEACRM